MIDDPRRPSTCPAGEESHVHTTCRESGRKTRVVQWASQDGHIITQGNASNITVFNGITVICVSTKPGQADIIEGQPSWGPANARQNVTAGALPTWSAPPARPRLRPCASFFRSSIRSGSLGSTSGEARLERPISGRALRWAAGRCAFPPNSSKTFL